MDNLMIARRLSEHANALERAETTLFRVRAYRQAAATVQAQARPLLELYEAGGRTALAELPHIGTHLAYTIEGLLRDGTFRTLRPVDAHLEPDRLLTSLAGIGPWLALRLRERLGVDTVEELEEAVRAGRLDEAGLGAHRSQVVRAALAERSQRTGLLPFADTEPSVADLLAVDAAFREHTQHHQTLASNGLGSWLPPFRTERNGWRFRARFARSSLASRTDAALNWVEVHFERPGRSGQRQVVTATRGQQAGGRVVRGRERECREMSGRLSDSGRAG
jgi:hypothetical protein